MKIKSDTTFKDEMDLEAYIPERMELQLVFILGRAMGILLRRASMHYKRRNMRLRQEQKMWLGRIIQSAKAIEVATAHIEDDSVSRVRELARGWDFTGQWANASIRMLITAFGIAQGTSEGADKVADALLASAVEADSLRDPDVRRSEIEWFRLK